MTIPVRLRDGRPVSLRAATAPDLGAMQLLLTELKLPIAGIEEWWPHFTLAESNSFLVGIVGVERYDEGILLRSVAVHPDWRSSGLGRALVDTALREASRQGSREVYLLTTTAEGYFPRLGFTVIPRADVPASVQGSVEFRGACPDSAVVMHRSLSMSEGSQ